MPAGLEQPAVLDPETMARREAGLARLATMGVSASVAGIVLRCPDPEHSDQTGTLADMLGVDSPLLEGIVTEMITDGKEAGQTPDQALEERMKYMAQRDEAGQFVRVEMPDPTQKKTLKSR